MFEEKAKNINFQKKKTCDCLNLLYIVIILWRISCIIVRFVIYCLMWCVVGGVYFTIFAVLTVVIGCGINIKWERMSDAWVSIWCVCCIEIATIEVMDNGLIIILRILYDLFGLIIVTVFAFTEFDCDLCADQHQRQVLNNPYILMFILLGLV